MHINPKQEIRHSKFAMFGIGMLLLLLTIAIFGPLLTPYQPYSQTPLAFEHPSLTHWLGTNHVGQDIFSQLIYGARTSLLVGFSAAFLATILSAIIGCALVVLVPTASMQAASLISLIELVIAPLPNAVTRPATVGECQSRAQWSILFVSITPLVNFWMT